MDSPEKKRPKPEDFLRLIERQSRGKHKIYLGSSAGVGKTYQMLAEGHRLREKGVDVVIGYVEPHDRPETSAQIKNLEIVPPRTVTYQGSLLRDMDLPAILNRKPSVVLVDELAHTNAPGSVNAKRYEDVEDLLATGLHVISTVNVQHLESLYDTVEKSTGVKVQERVPDRVLHVADQIVNVDISAEDLQDRLKAGKVYPPAQIATALENFFTTENLNWLREVALSQSAKVLDFQQRQNFPDETKPSALGKVMVAISSRGPHAETLLRKAARLALDLNAEWYAVYVRTPRESQTKMSLETERLLHDTLAMAQRMGGSVIILKGAHVPETLATFAREQGITHLVLGRPQRSKWPRLFSESFWERVMHDLPGVDLVIV